MSIKKDIVTRIYIAFIAVCIIGAAVVFQASKIQFSEGEYWTSLADSLTISYRSIEAERGNVLSADGRILATSLPFFEIRADFVAVSEKVFSEGRDSLAIGLAALLKDHSKNYYLNKIKKARRTNNRYLKIASGVSYPDLQTIKSFPIFKKGRYRGGLLVIQKNKRITPYKMLAHRTIGYVRDGVLPVGLEGAFDEELAGVRGQRLMQRIAGGTWVPINDEDEISSIHGRDIVTTIDINLQDVAEKALLKAIQKHRADHGSVVVMDVKTGQIKAIANIGKVGDDNYWERYNYAIGEANEPGSTFKTASMMALFEDGYVDINDSVDLEKGRTEYYDKVMKDSDKHDYRNVTAKMAFEISSNVGISKMVNKYYASQPEKFVAHLKEFGLHQQTGVEIKGEANPIIKDADDKTWSGISLPWMSVGYELTLTPIQMLTFYNGIANGGKIMKPYLVNEIQEYGNTVTKIEPEVLNSQMCSESTLRKIKLLLEGVVENGTADNLKTPHYKIAGKTGTAQIAQAGRYQKVYQASFAGYFPADNPQYSCIVVVNAPKSGVYYGGWVAGPVFREIADKAFSGAIPLHQPEEKLLAGVPSIKAGFKPDMETIYNELDLDMGLKDKQAWLGSEVEEDTISFNDRAIVKGEVPDVRGMGLRDALYLLENEGLKVKVKGKGRVVLQSVIPGTRSTKGREIILTLS